MNEKELYSILADEKSIQNSIKSLNGNGFEALVVETATEAKEMVLRMLPKRAEVMTMTSVTLDTIGISKEINENGNYSSVREKLSSMNRETQVSETQKLGAAPDWVIGSVHAVTEDGKVMIASATGSQLPAYVYGSSHVIWIVGSQKIVKDMEEGLKRIYEYVFPLENERAMKAYGMGSGVNKLLIVNKEVSLGRITIIIVKEKLGF
ncbi:MAG: hypothetical protein ACD_14C00061G0004 [uncultured bacterium]|nr:MAG: hypothetical protein ACD_14C00061G0004 [uncultured bacterium]KKQ45694.1 MAG: hypothetical protein US63_C0012G0029 [Candidatus Moranbacteria bacterium GW2011_GWC2_37_8]KKQ62844.1 MAG: hypothetical protein US82_C0005G0017 [Parcubacteria group bacterium GW2011_GWC1_38_22]KKQ81101.1 MAG: hypothetical protein UT03_C0012G0003 [Candidatus Moranbacteria bacterium GW2011_GWD2_38_7]